MTHAVLRISPERLYWSIVQLDEGNGSPGPARRLQALDAREVEDMTAPDFPLGREELHLASVRVGHWVVACAISHVTLAEMIVAQPPLLSACPSSIPPCVLQRAPAMLRDVLIEEAPRLELLTGVFTPKVILRLRHLRRHAVMGCIALAGLILGVAWTNSAKRSRDDALAANAVVNESLTLIAKSSRKSAENGSSGATPCTPQEVAAAAFTLPSDLAAARTARSNVPRRLEDAASTLSGFLAAWPPNTAMNVDQVSVQQGTVYVQCGFETRAAADTFSSQFRPPNGWIADPPRMHAAGSRTMLSMCFRAKTGAP